MNRMTCVSFCAILGVGLAAVAISARGQEPGGGAGGEKSVLIAGQEMEAGFSDRDFCHCVGESDSPMVAKIELALRNPLQSTGLDFIDTPLEEVVGALQETYGIAIKLDLPALDEIGLGPEEPVTVNLHNISLRSALRLMLRTLQLTYVIRDEVLMFTTPEEGEALLLTCVYDVRGLISDPSDKASKALTDTIISCIATETWAANGGGEAEIRMLNPGLLVVSQTQAVHDEVGGLLSAIRTMRGERPAPVDAAARDAEKVVTRSYWLQISGAGDTNRLGGQVRELIVQSMPHQRWNGRLEDGQAVVLAVLPDRVVLRHKQSVQDEVQSLLVDSAVAAPAAPGGMSSGAFGGGRGGGIFQPDPSLVD